ncbi:hypothetical protein N656DRAFT_140948 [Canariomyces notabilis]|uniref:Uncharacterized protein n=1 Tax=Canariomyces notabilis TaxID=2074819 RepID=A0AAN6TBZ8_9PEZI|nr:hypothetical protein N656DRAFT_140948 [Canariomyces arenarius]
MIPGYKRKRVVYPSNASLEDCTESVTVPQTTSTPSPPFPFPSPGTLTACKRKRTRPVMIWFQTFVPPPRVASVVRHSTLIALGSGNSASESWTRVVYRTPCRRTPLVQGVLRKLSRSNLSESNSILLRIKPGPAYQPSLFPASVELIDESHVHVQLPWPGEHCQIWLHPPLTREWPCGEEVRLELRDLGALMRILVVSLKASSWHAAQGTGAMRFQDPRAANCPCSQ